MKILVIPEVNRPHSWDEHLGGMEAFAIETAKIFIKYGYSAEILTTSDYKGFKPECIKTWDHPSKETFWSQNPRKKYLPKEAWSEACQWIKDNRFDLVISNLRNVRMQGELAETVEAPIVHMNHCILVFRFSEKWCQDMKKIKDRHGKTLVIAVSNYLKNHLNEKCDGFVDDIWHETFCMPKALPFLGQPKNNVVVYTGRICKEKHVDRLLDFYKDSEFELYLMGAPQKRDEDWKWYEEEFIPTVARYKNLHYLGSKPQNEMFEFLKFAACYILPRHTYETFCLSAFEALKLGVPAVCNVKRDDEAVSEYMIQGKSGYCVNTYRKSAAESRRLMLEATRKAVELDRKWIFNHFDKNYSDKKYIDDILEKVWSRFSYCSGSRERELNHDL